MTSDRNAAILAEQVNKSYGGDRIFGRGNQSVRAALTDVSFTLHAGETLGLLGPNGAGKTTLLKTIATLLAPTSGRVLVNGFDVVRDSLNARRNLGLVNSDERSFYWRLTGRQNLDFFASLYGIPEKLAKERVNTLLDVLGLTHAADRPFLGYSSGMKQKLAIIRGLMNEPAVVLYDEPTRALDPLSAQQIRRWILDHQTRVPHQAHLLATNQLHEAEQLCHRVMIINRGTLIAYGTIDEVRRSLREHDYATHRITCRGFDPSALVPSVQDGLLDVTGESHDGDTAVFRIRTLKNSDALDNVLAVIVRAHARIVAIESEVVSFDDVFCALVTGNSAAESPQEIPVAAAVGR